MIQNTMFPMHFIGKTSQEFITVNPSWVEVLGEVEEVGEGIYICQKHDKLYNQYMTAIRDWQVEISGLHLPTQSDLLNVNSSKK